MATGTLPFKPTPGRIVNDIQPIITASTLEERFSQLFESVDYDNSRMHRHTLGIVRELLIFDANKRLGINIS